MRLVSMTIDGREEAGVSSVSKDEAEHEHAQGAGTRLVGREETDRLPTRFVRNSALGSPKSSRQPRR